MSLLMFSLRDDGYTVITDSLATDETGEPAYFTSKAIAIPHLRMVVASTGYAFLGHAVVDRLLSPFQCRDIVLANLHLPEMLVDLWSGGGGRGLDGTTTLYTFGLVEATGLYVGFAYRSAHGFVPEPLARNGFGIKPAPLGDFRSPDGRDEFVALAERVRAEQSALPIGKRIHIGGELHLHEAQNEFLWSTRLHRFSDFDEQWERMNEVREAHDLHTRTPST